MAGTHAEATQRARAALTAGLEREVAELRRLRPGRRVFEIALFALLWGAGIGLGLWGLSMDGGTAASWLARGAGILAAAVALNALYLLSHEGHHGLLFRGPRANHAASFLLCAPLLHGPTAYRVLHEQHHWHLGGPGDPDEYRNYARNRRSLWALHWTRLLLGTWLYVELIPLVGYRRAGAADRRRILAEYALLVPLHVAVFLLVPIGVLLQVWLLPGLLVCYFSALRALAQHALTDPADPRTASRSVRCGPVAGFLLLHENYHAEHHLFPEVPSYHLPRLRALLRPRMGVAVEDASYTRFLLGFVWRSLKGDDSVLGLTREAGA